MIIDCIVLVILLTSMIYFSQAEMTTNFHLKFGTLFPMIYLICSNVFLQYYI
ncbi:hypothetical protein GLYMA_18G086350v4 [Glycine max]|nr:hypothetical protein GLYMA_18G086350v4 [Glycine max]KAH1153804.1 hypothetical protein GYH30_049433 [Glycine max]